MRNPLKKPESVYNIIFETVTKNRKAVLESARACKQLFKQKDNPANPNVLFELEEVLRARQDEEALAKHIDPSKQKNGPKTPDELKGPLKTKKEDYEYYIQDFLPALKKEIAKSDELDQIKKTEVEKVIMRIITSDAISKIIGENQGPKNSGADSKKELEKPIETPKPSDGPGSRASSPVPSEKSPPSSPVSSRRGSISTTLSSVGGDGDLQKRNEDQPQPEQSAKKEPKKQGNENPGGQVYPAKEEPEIPVPATLMTDDDHTKDPMKSKETERKNTIVQKPSANENNSEDTPPEKQPNNRNFRIALATGCALSAIGCLIAGVVTLGMVGAGLLVMSVVLAIAAAVTRYLTPPSSELTSTDLSPLIDDGKQR
ncbi:MAG: hypothetical protein LBH78_00285 [Rickettsiales bacterium]|jgi:hypothetical protein|nr:hypothetical protein [Rickettsiales bacterium]